MNDCAIECAFGTFTVVYEATGPGVPPPSLSSFNPRAAFAESGKHAFGIDLWKGAAEGSLEDLVAANNGRLAALVAALEADYRPRSECWLTITSDTSSSGYFRIPECLWHLLSRVDAAYSHNLELFDHASSTDSGFFEGSVLLDGNRIAHARVESSFWRVAVSNFLETVLSRIDEEVSGKIDVSLVTSPGDGQGGFAFSSSCVKSLSRLTSTVSVCVPGARGSTPPHPAP